MRVVDFDDDIDADAMLFTQSSVTVSARYLPPCR